MLSAFGGRADFRLDPVSANDLDTPVNLICSSQNLESAIRNRGEDRRARIARVRETVGRRADQNSAENLKNLDPIAFLQRRSESLAQRSADLDKLAEAWQPLYKTLSPEQRLRMAALAIFVITDMSDVAQRRRAQSEDDD